MTLISQQVFRIADSFLHSDLIRDVVETYAVRVLTIGVGLVTSVIVARILGPEGRGVYGVACTIGAIGAQFGNMGLHSFNTYYMAKDRLLLPMLLGNSLLVSLAVGSAIAAGAWIILDLWPRFAPIQGNLLFLSLLLIPLGLVHMLLQNLLIGLRAIRAFNQVEAATKIVTVIFIVFLLLVNTATVQNVFLATLSAIGVGIVLDLWRLLPNLSRFPTPSLMLLKKSAVYGSKAYIASLFAFLVLQFDLIIIKKLLGAEQAGYYSVAANTAYLLYLLPMIAGLVLFPKLSSLSQTESKWQLARRATWAVFAAMLPLSLTAILSGKFLLGILYGKAFLPSTVSFMTLCVAMIFYGANNIVSNYFAAIGFPWFSVYVWIPVTVLNIILNLMLIPRIGITGAALASLICYALILVLQYTYALKTR